MDLLEECNLLLQSLNPSLQVQPGQSGIVNILETNTKKWLRKATEKVKRCSNKINWEEDEKWRRQMKGKVLTQAEVQAKGKEIKGNVYFLLHFEEKMTKDWDINEKWK